jgi:hypothetical protein
MPLMPYTAANTLTNSNPHTQTDFTKVIFHHDEHYIYAKTPSTVRNNGSVAKTSLSSLLLKTIFSNSLIASFFFNFRPDK